MSSMIINGALQWALWENHRQAGQLNNTIGTELVVILAGILRHWLHCCH